MRAHDTDSSISCLVSSKGRVFYMEDCAPISLPGNNNLPDDWHLTARDAFNGILLWKIPVKNWGWREWKETWFASRVDNIPVNVHRRVVAVGDKVYALGYHAGVSEIDAATGEVLRTYRGTENTREILWHNVCAHEYHWLDCSTRSPIAVSAWESPGVAVSVRADTLTRLGRRTILTR